MGCCFSKTKETTGLEEPILTIDEIYKPERPIFSMEEYYKVVGVAKTLRKKYNPILSRDTSLIKDGVLGENLVSPNT